MRRGKGSGKRKETENLGQLLQSWGRKVLTCQPIRQPRFSSPAVAIPANPIVIMSTPRSFEVAWGNRGAHSVSIANPGPTPQTTPGGFHPGVGGDRVAPYRIPDAEGWVQKAQNLRSTQIQPHANASHMCKHVCMSFR